MRLEARRLAFGHPGSTIGRGLDFALDRGQVLCVLGPNGAGKTTLFRTLLGLLAPHGGQVLLGGRDLAGLARGVIAREVAYVPQASSAVFEFSLQEIVEMGRAAHLGAFEQPSRRDRERARAALERLGIAHLRERAFGAVSGGERQLALIARALATDAPCLVMDEPTAHLDYGNEARVLAELSRLRDEGMAMLLCTHDPAHAFHLADQVLLLERGTVLSSGPMQIMTTENLSRLYGVPVVVTEVETSAGPRRTCLPVLSRRATPEPRP